MDRQDAARVVAYLAAAFPTYPMDEDTTQLYIASITKEVHDPAVAYAVVQDWVMSRIVFPKIAEILEECKAEHARRSKRNAAIARGAKAPDSECPGCHGSGYEDHPIIDAEKIHASYAGATAVLPCRVCEPVRHEDWRDGHNLLDHNSSHCEWQLCVKRAEQKTKPKRGAVDRSGSGESRRPAFQGAEERF